MFPYGWRHALRFTPSLYVHFTVSFTFFFIVFMTNYLQDNMATKETNETKQGYSKQFLDALDPEIVKEDRPDRVAEEFDKLLEEAVQENVHAVQSS
jgi:hypothetical protein